MKFSSSLSMLVILIFTLFSSTTFAGDFAVNSISFKGESNTRLGDYQIKELAPVTLNGVSMRAFELSYQNAGNPVMIYLDDHSSCGEYIVRSKNLEVKYVCNKAAFGAKLITGKLRQYDPLLNANFLAKDELNKQSKIADGGLEVPSALGLIASYYPGLFSRPDLLN
jgi:hypothetical protein